MHRRLVPNIMVLYNYGRSFHAHFLLHWTCKLAQVSKLRMLMQEYMYVYKLLFANNSTTWHRGTISLVVLYWPHHIALLSRTKFTVCDGGHRSMSPDWRLKTVKWNETPFSRSKMTQERSLAEGMLKSTVYRSQNLQDYLSEMRLIVASYSVRASTPVTMVV